MKGSKIKTKMDNILEILKFQSENGISDVHLTSYEKACMRDKTGDITEIGDKILSPNDIERFFDDILSKEEIKDVYKYNGGDFAKDIDGIDGRFRINVFKEHRGYGITIRYISHRVPDIDELDISDEIIEIVNNSTGLFLLTGPNNSGKTTMMNAIIDYLNSTRKLNIITFEDPIEYVHKKKKSLISQCIIPKDFHDSARQLKSVFRQDADVVCVGEIRGVETMETVLTMCESGYFVIATLHTIDAVQTIERILNMFSPEKKRQLLLQLSNQLKGVVCQTLVQYKEEYSQIPCREIMIPDDAISHLIRTGNIQRIYSRIETTSDQGNILFDQYLVDLFEEGMITEKTLKENYHSKSFVKAVLGDEIEF